MYLIEVEKNASHFTLKRIKILVALETNYCL